MNKKLLASALLLLLQPSCMSFYTQSMGELYGKKMYRGVYSGVVHHSKVTAAMMMEGKGRPILPAEFDPKHHPSNFGIFFIALDGPLCLVMDTFLLHVTIFRHLFVDVGAFCLTEEEEEKKTDSSLGLP